MTLAVRALTLLAVFVGWSFTAPAAFFGTSWIHHSSTAVPVMVFAGVVGPLWWRDRTYLRLPAAERRHVDAAVGEGVPTGDARLDAIALERLTRAAGSARSDRIARPLAAAAFLAVPVVAAVRVSPWFLLSLVPALWVAYETARRARREDPRLRWARWTQPRTDDTTTTAPPPPPYRSSTSVTLPSGDGAGVEAG